MLPNSFSLRRHYPDQVLRVKDYRSLSQPGNTGLPVDDDKVSIELSATLVKIRNCFYGCFGAVLPP